MMQDSRTLEVLTQLGQYLVSDSEKLLATAQQAERLNPWFTQKNIRQSLTAIAEQYLNSEQLAAWAASYPPASSTKTIGLILAGNIPLVGFHDLLAVLVSGHRALIRLSSKDEVLFNHILEQLFTWEPSLKERIVLTERLKDFDAVIATGSNNSARYFDYYFSKYPNIIRKNRNGVAVLTGTESPEQLQLLSKDVLDYFGLGCRNVSKIFVPEDYAFEPLMEALDGQKEVIQNNKYKNNFDYNLTLLLLNKIPHYVNECMMVTESESLHARIATLHYQKYTSVEEAYAWIKAERDHIQCVVDGMQHLAFGGSQRPGLKDYADNVDTLAFLSNL
ncbi:MAG: acyl-CoA reductase [Saprospiraceae bacterium]|nr:acyl-CoA reductase [Saprospiraceae bacterium]